jgi:hypothetical protein
MFEGVPFDNLMTLLEAVKLPGWLTQIDSLPPQPSDQNL